MIKVKTCPQCGQAFSTTAAGLELLYTHLIPLSCRTVSRHFASMDPVW